MPDNEVKFADVALKLATNLSETFNVKGILRWSVPTVACPMLRLEMPRTNTDETLGEKV